MKITGMNEIRSAYLDFFEERNHLRLDSYSLIPDNDKSLLLINAGMAPLKQFFTGEKKMAKNRATSSQRCIRTADIDRVGKTQRHATFFEMLGNFSFGDYFKKDAILWAWEFLTETLGLEKDKLWVSVYHEDDEAYDLWHDMIGLPAERILRLGKEDNFWELEQGPCGPCSEIQYDRGEAYGPGKDTTENSDRFMEVWNLVFTQFDKKADGTYVPLEHPNIDTGMGLERIALVCEGADNVFDLAAVRPIRDEIERLSGKKYGVDSKTDESIRVILDHTKALTFLVYDGVIPSNEERGYVLRRLLRRAYRHGKLLGIDGEFLNAVVDKVIEVYHSAYPELVDSKDRIHRIVAKEEANFQETIDQGLRMLKGLVEKLQDSHETELGGQEAFKLYDTYGFPLDLTMEILEEKGLKVDVQAFEAFMQQQKVQSRERRRQNTGFNEAMELDLAGLEKTKFVGYDHFQASARVQAIYVDEARVDTVESGQDALIVLDETPFYAEGGGQIGDIGAFAANGVEATVSNTSKNSSEVFFHEVHVNLGNISVGDTLEVSIDADRRRDTMKNHSATHLLHKALRMVLGDHVHQAGSYVDNEHLRFDFTHFEALTKEQVVEIEQIVNRQIYESLPVDTKIMSREASEEVGAMGLFEDKYKDEVRVISMGDFSRELCGGTHVDNTSQIQMMLIQSEIGIAAGVRRIEATTGRACYMEARMLDKAMDEIAQKVKSNRDNIFDRLDQIKEEIRAKDAEIKAFQKQKRQELSGALEDGFVPVDGVDGLSLLTAQVEDATMDDLKEMADRLKDNRQDYVIVLASELDGKVNLVVTVDKNWNKKGLHAGQIVKHVATTTGGNGGGRPDFAQAGGKDVTKLPEAFASVGEFVRQQMK